MNKKALFFLVLIVVSGFFDPEMYTGTYGELPREVFIIYETALIILYRIVIRDSNKRPPKQ